MKRLTFILTIIVFPILLFAQISPEDQYVDAYIVIADSSQDYYDIRHKMFDLADKLKLDVDTMGRGYNKSKNLICLPDNDEDEIYAGDYFPRRYPSNSLSLEYLDYYTNGKKPNGGTIAIVVAITHKQEIADKTLSNVKPYFDSAFILKTQVYMGCMH